MSGNLKKFVNPKFTKTVDLQLMRRLLARHEPGLPEFPLDLLDRDEPSAREALAEFFADREEDCPEGLCADLHRIAELGTGRGLEIILTQAAREGIELFPELRTGDAAGPNRAHDPKHIALRVFLDHPELFEIAADHMAMVTADRLHEYAGRERGVTVDLTGAKVEAFRAAVADLFRDAFLGDFCRVRDHLDGEEINLVISHGSLVATVPVIEGAEERVISIREVSHAVLRYSESTGVLRMARVRQAHRPEVAELFARIILDRPGFFAAEDAQDLYTLRPVERAGFGYAFDHRYDPEIEEVLIISASADLMSSATGGYPRVEHSLTSERPGGEALRRFRETPVDFGSGWRLGELKFRILFRAEPGKRPSQVTVRLQPPGRVQFRRTRHEERVMTLIERNGLLNDRDDLLVTDAA